MSDFKKEYLGSGITALVSPEHTFGTDAVLLADFAKAGPEDTVLDLCSGNGAVAFILYAKYHPAKVCGLELQEAAAGLAQESAKLNGLSERISFTCGDAPDISEHFSQGSFSLVVCNPPYFEDGRGVSCGSDPKHLARHESTAGLEDFFSAAEYALKAGGSLCMIHRPERLADLMELSRRHGWYSDSPRRNSDRLPWLPTFPGESVRTDDR